MTELNEVMTEFPRVEILEGEYFVPGSMAQFCFRVIAAEELGVGLDVEGEVFHDSVVVNGTSVDLERVDGEPEWACDDAEAARRIVTESLFRGHPTLF